MKNFFIFLFLAIAVSTFAQETDQKIIIITTDGFRWQEVFNGMDSAIANNEKFNQGDSAYLFKTYWHDDATERRKKLLPFLWSTIAMKGQILGNRQYENKVNVSNPYWFSYPGYSEIFTGFADTAINSNEYPPNPNKNVLAFLNDQPAYKGKVAVFGAWDAFDRILNEEQNKFPVFSAFDSFGGSNPSAAERLINAMNVQSHKPWGDEECLDVFTHFGALSYLKEKKPKVLYIAYGETDEWAHSGKYRFYLEAAHQVDAWLKSFWNYIQSDPYYKNKTTLLITTDHGRGDAIKEQWTSHSRSIEGADEIWIAAIGPKIESKGERKDPVQLYQAQLAQTIAKLLGYDFKARHKIAPAIPVLFKK